MNYVGFVAFGSRKKLQKCGGGGRIRIRIIKENKNGTNKEKICDKDGSETSFFECASAKFFATVCEVDKIKNGRTKFEYVFYRFDEFSCCDAFIRRFNDDVWLDFL